MLDDLLSDEHFMRLALGAASTAAAVGEVPVGAVVVRAGVVIATAHNAPVSSCDPSGHAEVRALRAAALHLGNYRLDDCEMFVTLEPCAMCAGAALHSRLKRLIFGAPEPKSGAAGSVLNLFDMPALNHHTATLGGVLADDCSKLLQQFFQTRRKANKTMQQQAMGLRDDALRTPNEAFAAVPDFPWQPRYINNTASLNGLRMHYLDEGDPTANQTFLCLHGNPAWSYLYRKMIPVFLASGARVVAPDLIGFGRSDKPKRDDAHQFEWHRQTLLDLIEALDLKNITLVVQDWGGVLGLTLPVAAPQRFKRLLVMNTALATGQSPLSAGFIAWRAWCASNPLFDVAKLFARSNAHLSAAQAAAYQAPFVSAGHRAALRAFPAMVPEFEHSPGAQTSQLAQAFWRNADNRPDAWTGQSFMAIGEQDPVLGPPVMHHLRRQIRGCPEPMMLPNAGHFVQEHGREVAEAALAHWQSLSNSVATNPIDTETKA